MLLFVLLIHMSYAADKCCSSVPSATDTVSVHFDAILSPQFIERWNSLSNLLENDLIQTDSLNSLSELSEEGGVFFQEHLDSTDFVCLGSVDLAADSLYSVEAQWLVDSAGVMGSMMLCITPDKSGVELPMKYTTYDNVVKKSAGVERAVYPLERASTYSGGSGSSADPYQIATAEDLIQLSLTSTDWSSHFIQTANIIFSSDYISEDWNGDGSINGADAYGMQPIGTSAIPFSGTYDGANFRIKYLLVDNGEDDAGMFGYCDGATLINVGLAKAYIYGWNYVGALVGYCDSDNSIVNCYTTGVVSGFRYVGGLIGYVRSSTIVDQCISTCAVDGFLYVAGFIGCTKGKDVVVVNSVSAGSVDGFVFTGGLIGSSGSATVEDVYSSTVVDGAIVTGGLIGNSGNGEVTDAYWDVEASGVTSSAGSDVQGLTSEEMTDSTIFENWDTAVWTFHPDLNGGLPIIEDQSDFYEPVETEFVGSGSWDDPDNWTNGVPDTEEVTTAIISGECDLDDPVAVENLIIENGGVLNVVEEGDVVVVDELVIVSDSTGSGEFFTPENASVDTVEQEKFFPGGKWTFMSIPITLKADEIFPNLQLASWWDDPDGDYWVVEYSEDKRAREGTGMKDIFDGDQLIEAGKGYMVWVEDDEVSVFKHIIPNNSSMVDTEFSENYALNNAGWNLVGNPFTYTMTYEDVFDCEYNKANFSGAVYLWDGQGYKTWVDGVGDMEASVISPLEAFFVKRKSGSNGHFCMTKGQCQCTSVEVKSSAIDDNEVLTEDVLTVRLMAGEDEDKTYLRMLSHSADDKGAYKFEIEKSTTSIIYTSSDDGVEFAINALSVEKTQSVPLRIVLRNGEETIKLEFSYKDSLYSYVLYDAFKNVFHELNSGKILTFTVSENDDLINRFSILVKSMRNHVETSEKEKNEVQNKLIDIVTLRGGVGVRSLLSDIELVIYDLNGQEIKSSFIRGGSYKYISLKSGIYIVNAISENQYYSQKLVVF